MPYFAVQYNYADEPAKVAEHRPAHRAFLRGLLDEGTLLAAGAYTDDPAGALLLLRADSVEEVNAALDNDPFRRHALITDRTTRGWSAAIGPWAN